jgi:hypothetical protein
METKTKILLGVSAFLLVVVVFLSIKCLKNNNQTNKESYQKKSKETYEIRENFPQTSSFNLLYTDQNGNLGATSDVGITNLTVNSNAQIQGTHTISGKATMNGGATVNGGATINGGATVDTLNATSSITSPTITNLLNEIAYLKNRVSSLEDKLINVTNDGTGNITVKGNISSTKNISAGNALQFAGNYWSLSNINAGTIRFTRVDGGFADFYITNCGGNNICGTQGI